MAPIPPLKTRRGGSSVAPLFNSNKPRYSPPPVEENDDQSSYYSERSEYGESEYESDSQYDDDESSYQDSVVDSAVSSQGSVESINQLLTQLEYDDNTLTQLIINCKSINKEDATYIGKVLKENTSVKKIIFKCSKSNRSSHRQIFHKVALGLKENKYIKHLEIHNATIDHEMASYLVPSFAHNKTIQHISLVNCTFIGAGVSILCVALQHNKHIRHLSFNSCDWDEHNTDTIAASLPFLTLHSLSLIGINIAEDSWSYLLQSIERSKDMIMLDLSNNEIDAKQTNLLTKCLKAQKRISKLTLSDCGLDYRCMKELATGLRKYTTITELNISHNKQMTDKGVVYFKDLLKFNNSIQQLNVQGCNLNAQSIQAIDDGLRHNNSFLKSFFSEKTTKALFGVVDSIEQFDINETTNTLGSTLFEAVSFESSDSPRKKKPVNNKKSGGMTRSSPSKRSTQSTDRNRSQRPTPPRRQPNQPRPRPKPKYPMGKGAPKSSPQKSMLL